VLVVKEIRPAARSQAVLVVAVLNQEVLQPELAEHQDKVTQEATPLTFTGAVVVVLVHLVQMVMSAMALVATEQPHLLRGHLLHTLEVAVAVVTTRRAALVELVVAVLAVQPEALMLRMDRRILAVVAVEAKTTPAEVTAVLVSWLFVIQTALLLPHQPQVRQQ
jgi:hypothetical protein